MALPQSPYLSSYTPSRSLFGSPSSVSSGGGASMQTYQQRARELLARAGARGHGGGGGSTSAAMTRSMHGGSIGDVVAENTAPGLASVAFGALDASAMGASFERYINNVAKPTTIAFVLGIGLRAANWDKSHPKLRSANNVLLRTMFPVLGYRLGERLVKGSLFQGFMKKAAAAAPAKPAAPAKTAGVGGTEAPIPGERTTT